MDNCIFCHLDDLKTVIYEDDIVKAFLDIAPINEGHVLLIPKTHYLDTDEMPDEVLEWLTVGNPRPALLDVNHLSVRQLMRHPYLSFYQARDLVEYRQKHGSLSSLDDLQLLPSFTPEVIGRLRPYVEFK